jgi:hypothetical protein
MAAAVAASAAVVAASAAAAAVAAEYSNGVISLKRIQKYQSPFKMEGLFAFQTSTGIDRSPVDSLHAMGYR